MRFNLDASLVYRFAEPTEVLLAIEPARTESLRVLGERLSVRGVDDLVRFEHPSTGERQAMFTALGEVEIAYVAKVESAPCDHDFVKRPAWRVRDLPRDVVPFLWPSRYCPADRFDRFVERHFGRLAGGEKVAAILDWVAANLDYEAGASGPATGAEETFVVGAGVCRDFAHMAITLCRAAGVPARMVSAYAWRLEPPDLHAVVEVFLDGRWWLADPTRRAPVSGLVRVVAGRDAADVAFLNIFGRAELVSQAFSIQDSLASAASA